MMLAGMQTVVSWKLCSIAKLNKVPCIIARLPAKNAISHVTTRCHTVYYHAQSLTSLLELGVLQTSCPCLTTLDTNPTRASHGSKCWLWAWLEFIAFANPATRFCVPELATNCTWPSKSQKDNERSGRYWWLLSVRSLCISDFRIDQRIFTILI